MSDERVSDGDLTFMANLCDGDVRKLARELQQSRKRIAELEKQMPYVQHLPGCDILYSHKHSIEKCTCGLSELIGGE